MNDEERKKHNQKWYQKTYNNLVESRKYRGITRKTGDGLNKHHILPKCMGGKDEDNNYVLFTYREHVIAHMLLCKIYPHEPALFAAAAFMLQIVIDGKTRYKAPNSKSAEEYRLKAVKYTSEKMTEYYQSLTPEERSRIHGGPGRAKRGTKLSEEARRKISEVQKGKKRGPLKESTKKKLSEINRGKTLSAEHCKKMSEACKGRRLTEEQKKKRTILRGKDSHVSKKVIGPDGIIYDTVQQCADTFRCNRHSIPIWIRNNPEKGFRYYEADRAKHGGVKVVDKIGRIFPSIR